MDYQSAGIWKEVVVIFVDRRMKTQKCFRKISPISEILTGYQVGYSWANLLRLAVNDSLNLHILSRLLNVALSADVAPCLNS
jgi:hypothetical protein